MHKKIEGAIYNFDTGVCRDRHADYNKKNRLPL